MSETPPRSRWRKWAWPLGVLGALAVGVVLAEWAGWPFVKEPLESRLSKRLQREVRFGDTFSLRLFGSLRLQTSALRVGPPRGAQADPQLDGHLVDATDARLHVPYSTVFALMKSEPEGPPRITSLRFGRVDASLKRLADGRANWTLAPAKPPRPEGGATELPEIDELVVSNGHVALRDAMTKTAIDADVRTREGDKAGSADRTSSGGPGTGLVVEGQGRHEDRPVSFRMTSSGVLPLVSRDNADPVPVTIRIQARDAKFAFEGTGTDLLSFQGLDGSAALSGPSLAAVGDALGLTLPTTEPFDLKGRLSKSGDVWSLKRIDLDVGESRLGGDFTYDRRARPPKLEGQLTGSRLALADLLPAFGASPQPRKAPAPRSPEGRVLPQRAFDIPSLKAMNADVKVRLQRADLGSLFRQPLQPLQGDLTLQDGVLKLANLVARTAGGELKGGVGLDSRPALPQWSADVRWAGVELDQWLRPRNPATREVKPSGEKPSYVTGRLGGHAELRATGKSTAAMLASLDGAIQAWVRDGTMSHLVIEAAGIDVAQALGVLVKGDDRLPMHCAAVRAVAKGGRITPEVAIIDTPDTTLFVTGNVSLGEEKLALTMTARPKDMSPATLRSPVHFNGSFGKPQIEIDKQPLALKLLGAAALAAVHPLAALIPLFDPGDKEHAGGCERTLHKLRDADGPAGVRDAKAPKAPSHAAAAGTAAAPGNSGGAAAGRGR